MLLYLQKELIKTILIKYIRICHFTYQMGSMGYRYWTLIFRQSVHREVLDTCALTEETHMWWQFMPNFNYMSFIVLICMYEVLTILLCFMLLLILCRPMSVWKAHDFLTSSTSHSYVTDFDENDFFTSIETHLLIFPTQRFSLSLTVRKFELHNSFHWNVYITSI